PDPRRTRHLPVAAGLAGRGELSALRAVEREENHPVNRSFLFAPANVARRIEKALTLDADAVILDLEDSVAPSDKAAAGKSVAEALARERHSRLYVRVNGVSTPFCFRDVVETVRPGLDGVVVPKIESAADLHA